MEAELSAGGLGQQVIIEQGDERLLRLGEGTAAQGGRGRQAEASARTDAQPPEELLMVGLQRTVGQIEGGYHLRGVEARHTGVTQPRWGVRQFVDQAAEARRAIVRDPAGGELDRERQPPAQFHGRRDLIGVRGPALADDPPEQRDGLVGRQYVEGQRAAAEVGKPAPGGDQDQAPARHRQERADLVMPGRVVQDHDGATPAQVGPPQCGALADGFRYLRGRHGHHLEQAVQCLGWVERGAPGIVGMKVEVERPVRVLPGDQAGRANRQRGLPHARHALDDGDPRDAAVLPGERCELSDRGPRIPPSRAEGCRAVPPRPNAGRTA